jgi:c-di-GMP-binding flagellar brake protein YcgR
VRNDNAIIDLRPVLLRNTKLMVRLATDDTNTYYNSRIEDVVEDFLYISIPTYKGLPLKVMKDTGLFLSALTTNGRLVFESSVEGIVKEGIYMLKIKYPEKARQEQMRQFYRVPIHLRVKLVIDNLSAAKSTHAKGGDLDKTHDAYVENISGGGCSLVTSAPLSEGDTVLLDFTGTVIEGVGLVEGRVVRATPQNNDKKHVSLRYWEIDERVRDKFVKYVFRRQLELRQLTD